MQVNECPRIVHKYKISDYGIYSKDKQLSRTRIKRFVETQGLCGYHKLGKTDLIALLSEQLTQEMGSEQ